MAKKSVTAIAEERAERLAQKMGYEFVDVELAKEHGAAFLRIYVDKAGGMSLDDCAAFHHAIIGQIEDLEYDYLEISSPGVDRPLKRERDFERARGETVEVKLYKAQDGAKGVVFRTVVTADDSTSARVDGNNVNMEKEQLELWKAETQYAYLIQKLNGEYSNLRNIISQVGK